MDFGFCSPSKPEFGLLDCFEQWLDLAKKLESHLLHTTKHRISRKD
jgi:hypothetical protein